MISWTQWACSILVYCAAAAGVSGQTSSAVPTSGGIVDQMAQAQVANRDRFLPYTVTRDYKLFEGANADPPRSHVVADITVVPPDFKKYTIDNSAGSGLAERIVRKALDGEVAFAKDSAATDITRENYDFVLVGENQLSGRRCFVLELIPKRKSKNLLRGTIWIDAQSLLPYRVEGEPAKNPSWWLTDVRIDLRYGYVGPMWVQTSSKATANVRIIGPSSMTWEDVSYHLGDLVPDTALAQIAIPVRETLAEGYR
ncbi:MAG: outer membrane lipoprotein-sorting protein [Candidatus Acidiferrales bacterium]